MVGNSSEIPNSSIGVFSPTEVFRNTPENPEARNPVSVNTSPERVNEIEKSERDELLALMAALKVAPSVAQEIVASAAAAEIQLQLDCLADRNPKDAAAVFVSAVRGKWEVPAKYLERVEAAKRAAAAEAECSKARDAKVQQKAATAQQRANAATEEETLSAALEALPECDKKRIESQARERLGVLGMAGRAPAALSAMMRTLMRERLAGTAKASIGCTMPRLSAVEAANAAREQQQVRA